MIQGWRLCCNSWHFQVCYCYSKTYVNHVRVWLLVFWNRACERSVSGAENWAGLKQTWAKRSGERDSKSQVEREVVGKVKILSSKSASPHTCERSGPAGQILSGFSAHVIISGLYSRQPIIGHIWVGFDSFPMGHSLGGILGHVYAIPLSHFYICCPSHFSSISKPINSG